jgi:hypothetical protein
MYSGRGADLARFGLISWVDWPGLGARRGLVGKDSANKEKTECWKPVT